MAAKKYHSSIGEVHDVKAVGPHGDVQVTIHQHLADVREGQSRIRPIQLQVPAAEQPPVRSWVRLTIEAATAPDAIEEE